MRLLRLVFLANLSVLIGLCVPHVEAFGRIDPFYSDGRGAVRYDGGFGRVVVTW